MKAQVKYKLSQAGQRAALAAGLNACMTTCNHCKTIRKAWNTIHNSYSPSVIMLQNGEYEAYPRGWPRSHWCDRQARVVAITDGRGKMRLVRDEEEI